MGLIESKVKILLQNLQSQLDMTNSVTKENEENIDIKSVLIVPKLFHMDPLTSYFLITLPLQSKRVRP